MKDFHKSMEEAQQKKHSFQLAPPLTQEEKDQIHAIELKEQKEEENLRNEAQQELEDTHQQQEHTIPKNFTMQWLFLTLCYVGHAPKAQGTMGSLVATLLGVPILYYLEASNLFLLSILISIIAIKIINQYEKQGGIHDNKCIVIDELVGVWIALAIVGFGMIQILLAFVFFRVFDIWKPSLIGRIDRNVKGGLGVLGDDIVAGFFAGLLSLILVGAMQKLGLGADIFLEINPQQAQ